MTQFQQSGVIRPSDGFWGVAERYEPFIVRPLVFQSAASVHRGARPKDEDEIRRGEQYPRDP